MMNFYTAGLGEELSKETPLCINCGIVKCEDGTIVAGSQTQFHLEKGENGEYCSLATQLNDSTDLNKVYEATKTILINLGVPEEFIKRGADYGIKENEI